MIARIEFLKEFNEPILPIICLTKSRNKKTGTATFIFIRPLIFDLNKISYLCLKEIGLIWDNKKIVSNDMKIIFYKGKPFLFKIIFIFKNSKEWLNFLNFMQYYSNETGLYFTLF